MKVSFNWWYLAGGIGTFLTVVGLVWAVYSHFDMKAHDREMAEKNKSDVEIKIDVPDIDKAIEDVKDLRRRAKEAIGDKKDSLLSSESIKRYWRSKQDPFEIPFIEGTDEEISICTDDLKRQIDAELYENICG